MLKYSGQEEARLRLNRISRAIVRVEVAAALVEAKSLTRKLIFDSWNKVDEVVQSGRSMVRDAARALGLTCSQCAVLASPSFFAR